MNKYIVNTIIFLSGVVLGGVSTYLGMRHHFSEKLEREANEIREVYNEKVRELEPTKSSLNGEIEGPEEIEDSDKKTKVHLDKTKASYSAYLNNKPPLKDYTKYFKESSQEVLDLKEVTKDALSDAKQEIDPAELESPPDDIPYTDKEDLDQTLDAIDYELNGAHKRALEEDIGPYEIDVATFEGTCANYEKCSFVYYISDDVLIEENGAHPDEVDRFSCIGSLISDTGFDDNDEEIMYVRNDKLMCDYEITKVYTPFVPLGR